MNLHVDLGQIIITGVIALVGYLVTSQVAQFRSQLEKHETIIIGLVGDVQRLIGLYDGWNGRERRTKE